MIYIGMVKMFSSNLNAFNSSQRGGGAPFKFRINRKGLEQCIQLIIYRIGDIRTFIHLMFGKAIIFTAVYQSIIQKMKFHSFQAKIM